jgi:hypothetical protein
MSAFASGGISTQQAISLAANDLAEIAMSTARPATSHLTASTSNSLNLSQNLNKSVLFVNVKELNLKLYNEIIISWNVLESTTMHDWIGIYRPCKIF